MSVLAMFKVVPSWCWGALLIVALCLGCELHGRHAIQAKWDADKAAQKIVLAMATKRAEAAESTMNDKVKQANDERDTKIKDINSRLSAALVELRNRPKRRADADSAGAGTTGECAGASGAELSREDAKFLEGEAARADAIAVELNAVGEKYDSVTDEINHLRK